MECKFWIDEPNFDIQEVYSYKLSVSERRLLRKIVIENFGYIVEQWNVFQSRKGL